MTDTPTDSALPAPLVTPEALMATLARGDAVDVDVLAARVKRAAELLRVCRERITAARDEVGRIVEDLAPDAEPADG